jgi:ABC-type antimicrobial peptide transport system permease subunit
MALGARRSDVLRLVIGQGLLLAAVGTGVGLVGALAAVRVLSSLLYGVAPSDPGTLVSVVAILVTAALLAAWIPAQRATRIDPVDALRRE